MKITPEIRQARADAKACAPMWKAAQKSLMVEFKAIKKAALKAEAALFKDMVSMFRKAEKSAEKSVRSKKVRVVAVEVVMSEVAMPEVAIPEVAIPEVAVQEIIANMVAVSQDAIAMIDQVISQPVFVECSICCAEGTAFRKFDCPCVDIAFCPGCVDKIERGA